MTRPMTDPEQAVWYALRQGEANARPLAEIAAEAGLSRRDAEQVMERLRAELHEPVCAGQRGYFEAATLAELDAYIRQFDERIRTMVRTLHGLKKARVRMAEEAAGAKPIRGKWAA